jgi:endonuclease/exonuclease/phosphatase family metal-dependent hydrolase
MAASGVKGSLASSVTNRTQGPAILSRFPIIAWEAQNLPRCGGVLDPRVLVYATVRTPWGDLGVASTHTTRLLQVLLDERVGHRPELDGASARAQLPAG